MPRLVRLAQENGSSGLLPVSCQNRIGGEAPIHLRNPSESVFPLQSDIPPPRGAAQRRLDGMAEIWAALKLLSSIFFSSAPSSFFGNLRFFDRGRFASVYHQGVLPQIVYVPCARTISMNKTTNFVRSFLGHQLASDLHTISVSFAEHQVGRRIFLPLANHALRWTRVSILGTVHFNRIPYSSG